MRDIAKEQKLKRKEFYYERTRILLLQRIEKTEKNRTKYESVTKSKKLNFNFKI